MLLTFENDEQLEIADKFFIYDIVLQGFIRDFPGSKSIPYPIYSLEETKIYNDYVMSGICKCTMTVQKIAETLCNDFIKGKIRHELLPHLSVEDIVRNNYQDIIFYFNEEEKLDRLEYLWVCCEVGNLPILKLLKFTSKDIRSEDNKALIWASDNGHIEVVKYLCETYGLTIEDIRSLDNEALRRASEEGHIEVVKYLYETYLLTFEDIRSRYNNALRWASQYGHLEVVKYLCETCGLTIEDIREDDNYALRWASEKG